MIAKGPWVVGKVLNKQSRYGGMMYEVTLISNYGEIAHTYIDPDNRNYKKWEEIIDLYDRGWGIVLDDLRYKIKDDNKVYKNRTDEALINADSKIKQLYKTPDRQLVLDQLYEVLK